MNGGTWTTKFSPSISSTFLFHIRHVYLNTAEINENWHAVFVMYLWAWKLTWTTQFAWTRPVIAKRKTTHLTLKKTVVAVSADRVIAFKWMCQARHWSNSKFVYVLFVSNTNLSVSLWVIQICICIFITEGNDYMCTIAPPRTANVLLKVWIYHIHISE
jgi:hypothetical protein